MPVWHKGVAKWVKEGKLVLLGVTQEQHPDRCRLLAQWHGFTWPILHDPINVLEAKAVPILVAVDEHGVTQLTRPNLATFERDFLNKTFPRSKETAVPRIGPALERGNTTPKWEDVWTRAAKANTAAGWRQLGDLLTLWGGADRLDRALEAYARAVKLDPKDGPALFRLGVCHRMRYESPGRRAGDFQAAIDHWGRALELDPNQYIWRRRIQQYGPRLDKPYAFYDWVEEAEKAIRARGETPVQLVVRPGGAEIAQPLKALPEKSADRAPDPGGKVHRDRDSLVRAEVTVAPGHVRPGQAVRVHIVLRLNAEKKAHWNNEADPLRLWVEVPKGWLASPRLVAAVNPRQAVSGEARTLDFEVKAPSDARGKVRIDTYALYHVCDDRGGECRFLRLDLPVEVTVRP